jgi:UDPglucose 6-dehydrogenase
MRICVIGTGYVGLVVGAGLAEMGNEVVCSDTDAAKIAQLQRGEFSFVEPGLAPLVERGVAADRLRFTSEVGQAVAGAEVVFIAVGTPAQDDGPADLSQLMAAAEWVGPALSDYTVIAIKSTVPVGTAERVSTLLTRVARHPFTIVSNPEFLKEGDAVADFMKPERVIIGTTDERARRLLRHLYGPFVISPDRLLMMDNRSAELAKYAANALLASRVALINELAGLCEHTGADVDMVRRAVGADARIGTRFLLPGPGFGGSCLPKDLCALEAAARVAGVELDLVPAISRANERHRRRVGAKIRHHFGGGRLAGKRIAVWGIAFKAGTDDIRESPAVVLIEQLLEGGAHVTACDPAAEAAARRRFERRITYERNAYECVRGADALVVMTEWNEFRRPNFARIAETMAQKTVFDARNLWDPAHVRALGFVYYGTGRS